MPEATRPSVDDHTAPAPDAVAPAEGDDPRIAAFCAATRPEVFHAVAYHNDVWKDDPFDVATIHEEARAAFERLVHRASDPSRAASGRLLLLEGEAGSGKTHLLRAFRNWAHAGGRGYFGYLQMTSATNHYGRYVLNNLIDSLDQPYDERAGETSGLMRLSTAVAESPRNLALDRLDQIRGGALDHACLARLIDALADQIIMDDRFNNVDLDLVRALLYLQGNDPRIKGRVLKYLRCEALSDHDRELLGGIIPRSYDDAPRWVIQRLGELMSALESAPLILGVDQLEDLYSLDDASARFRRAMATLCDLVSRIPTAVVVITCLEDFYAKLRADLPRPIIDRIEKDPAPILLNGPRSEEEIVLLVAQRLRALYESLEVAFRDDDPTFPFPKGYLRTLAGMRTRDILERCQEYRDRCIRAGSLVAIGGEGAAGTDTDPKPSATIPLEQAWNDFRSAFRGEIPGDEEGLAAVLAAAFRACSDEEPGERSFESIVEGRMVAVTCRGPGQAPSQLLVGVCNITARGGHLGKQIGEVIDRAGESTPAIVRSTEFPNNPGAAVSKQIGAMIARGGRRAVIEDSDWRVMLALPRFRAEHEGHPAFAAWLQEGKPLSRLRSLRAILDLDRPRPLRNGEAEAPRETAEPVAAPDLPPGSPANGDARAVPEVSTVAPPTSVEAVGPIVIGTSHDRAQRPVTLGLAELSRHAAFLGGTGSGKTTVALNVVEQLLVRGVPAILIDRKGDLCTYARPESWASAPSDPSREGRRRLLRERVEIAVFTPGNPQGRPLSIAIVPAGLGRLGSFERGQVARYAASALAGMMNYGTKGTDPARQAILASAINLLAQLEPDATVTLPNLIEYVAEEDPGLVNAVGRLDTKLFEKLVQDLETLRLTRGGFLAAQGEPLDAEALLGLGPHARAGKTRLSIISTKSLGATQDVQFWVSQLLVEMARWASRSPSSRLQAVLLFDEADLYLPAQRQPPTKEPMEDLLKRARSAGIGLLLATQSPGDFDYKCRDNIRTWFVGRVKEPTALAKMKPMLSEARGDVAAKLPTQETGEFHLLRDGTVTSLRADLNLIPAEQVPEAEILALSRQTRGPESSPPTTTR